MKLFLRCLTMTRTVAGLVVAVSILLALTSSPARALEPPRPGELDRLRAEGTLASSIARAKATGNDRFAPDLIRRMSSLADPSSGLRTPAAVSPGSALNGDMPRTGVVRVPVVLIDFTDYPAQVTTAQVQQMMGGDGFPGYAPTESLRNYYLRSSYGALDIQPEVLGIYHYPGPRSEIDTSTGSAEQDLVQQAFGYFESQGADMSRYDANADGVMDYEVVFWTGPAGAWASFWWGHFGSSGDGDTTYDGKRLGRWSWQWSPSPGSLSASVVIHETGHALGLPDLYDYDDSVGPHGGVGSWDPMAVNRGDHNAFSKWMLGWLTPSVVSSGSQSLSLRPAGTYGDAAIVMPRYSADDPLKEFFLVEARDNSGNDAISNYPAATALQVWHFDAGPKQLFWPARFRFDNSWTSHKFARVIEADGLEEIEQMLGSNIGDLFTPGQTFGPSTVPSSTPYYGSSSGVAVRDISRDGSTMNFTASILGYDYDFTPPESTSTIPATWVSHDVTVTISASDPSGYDSYVRVPEWGDTPFKTWGDDFVVSTEGTTQFDFRSVDFAGNLEDTQTAYVRIDKTPPALNAIISETYVDSATIDITAEDALSGIASVEWRIDRGEWNEGSTAHVTAPGVHVFEFRASDVAGNSQGSLWGVFEVAQASGIKLSSTSATSLAYGAEFAIRGTLASHGVGLQGQEVILQSAAPGGSFKDTAYRATTETDGAFAFAVKPASKTSYRVRFAGADGYAQSSPSSSVYALPKAWVRTPIAPSTMYHSKYYSVYGYLKPRHTSGTYPVRIYRYRYVSGHWKSYGYVKAVASKYLDHTKYSARLRLPYRGRWRVRAYAPADDGHAAAWSKSYDYVTAR